MWENNPDWEIINDDWEVVSEELVELDLKSYQEFSLLLHQDL